MKRFSSDQTWLSDIDGSDGAIVELTRAKLRIAELERQIAGLTAGRAPGNEQFTFQWNELEQRSLASSILEVSRLPVFVLDEEDRFLLMNPSFLDTFPMSMAGGPRPVFAYELFTPEVLVDMSSARTAFGKGAGSAEFIWHRSDGAVGTYFEFQLFPIRSRCGTVESIAGILKDVSCLRRAVETAEAANRSKGEFLAMISHEIRTPLNSIISLSDLLDTSELGKEERQMVETISSSGHSLLNLINDVLDLSTVDSGQITLNPVEMDPRECLEQVGNLFGFRAREKGIGFSCSVDANVPHRLICDRERIVQVLNNLIGNAVKFTQKGDVQVHVGCEALANVEELDLWPEGDPQRCRPYRLLIRVKDTGIGISPSQQSHLFQPFSQGDASIRRRFGGSGLGLVISRRLARLMGGDIELESEMTVGSTFVFSLKADAKDALPQRNTPVSSARKQELVINRRLAVAHPLEILVVDDVSHNRLVMKTVLNRMGYNPRLASSGFEALEMLKKTGADLVFMDMLMPELSGIETCRMLRSLQSSGELRVNPLRVVALTANAMDQVRRECIAAGMDDFISKPIAFGEIQRCIVEASEAKSKPQTVCNQAPG